MCRVRQQCFQLLSKVQLWNWLVRMACLQLSHHGPCHMCQAGHLDHLANIYIVTVLMAMLSTGPASTSRSLMP